MASLFRRLRRPAIVLEAPSTDSRFRVFGGRRHLANTTYPLPEDMGEVNRLEFQHYLLRMAVGGNFIAPARQPRATLDVGSGSGRWAMEVAARFPFARHPLR